MTRTTGRTGTVSSTVHCPVGLILRVLVTARPGTRCTQPHVGGASGRGSRLTRPGPAKPGPQAEQLSPAALPERCCRHRDHRKLQLLRLGNLSSDAPSAGLADGRPARRLGNVQVRPAAGPGPGAPPRPAGGYWVSTIANHRSFKGCPPGPAVNPTAMRLAPEFVQVCCLFPESCGINRFED